MSVRLYQNGLPDRSLQGYLSYNNNNNNDDDDDDNDAGILRTWPRWNP